MPAWLVPLIVLDLIVMVLVVAWVVQRRFNQAAGTPQAPGLFAGLRSMAHFANERHQRIGEYLRANWSGVPDELPRVLSPLLDELERDAQARGVTMDRALLKTLVATSIRYHKLGRDSDVQKALERVA